VKKIAMMQQCSAECGSAVHSIRRLTNEGTNGKVD